ncbi:MAG: DNA/RNA non-specific endonuclease [Bacteroidia bacterium]|nr:DNA/RNA non-specific endonuclease [Bacteroidia bacterium]
MRPFALVFVLFIVGLGAWLLWEKFYNLFPSSHKTFPTQVSDKLENPSPDQPIKDSSLGSAGTVSFPSSNPSEAPSSPSRLIDYIALPLAEARSQTPCETVRHTYYTLCYDEEHEQPRWTVHILEGERLKYGKVGRTQDFRPDPKVFTQSAQLSDYRGSGYDRGHLVPAGDFKWDSVAMSETFYLSNMSPQLHEFNAGIWEAVESMVRSWARQKGRLVVYTGPVLNRVKKRVGKSRVSVPEAYYKVVYHLDEKAPSAVGFLVPHVPTTHSPLNFLVSVDSVEKHTGIDFFPALPDDVEERIESRLEYSRWRTNPRRR